MGDYFRFGSCASGEACLIFGVRNSAGGIGNLLWQRQQKPNQTIHGAVGKGGGCWVFLLCAISFRDKPPPETFIQSFIHSLIHSSIHAHVITSAARPAGFSLHVHHAHGRPCLLLPVCACGGKEAGVMPQHRSSKLCVAGNVTFAYDSRRQIVSCVFNVRSYVILVYITRKADVYCTYLSEEHIKIESWAAA